MVYRRPECIKEWPMRSDDVEEGLRGGAKNERVVEIAIEGLSQRSQIRSPDSKFSDSACRRFGSLGNVNMTAP
jgi:hypothetical protein